MHSGRTRRSPTEIAVVGVSVSENCGVRDHAVLLAEALDSSGASTSLHWLWRQERSLRASRAEIGAWTRDLAGELEERRPDVVLLHYSVFSYSYRGLPLFVRPALAAVQASSSVRLTMLHEFAYPWRYGDWRGNAWAISQRLALIAVMRAADGLLTTGESRVSWLESRRWLPRRRVLAAPVFSNLPPADAVRARDSQEPVVGLFGYSYQGAAVSLILDSLSELVASGVPVHLRLLGAPGPESPAGASWLDGARERNLTGMLSFSGALPAQALSNELAACEVLLFADAAGPTSRKGTLAASLASGRAVVAIDGPQSWPELLSAEAVQLADASPRGLAAAISALLGDADARVALGARGRSFAELQMGVDRTADAVWTLLDGALAPIGTSVPGDSPTVPSG